MNPFVRDPAKDLERQGIDPNSMQAKVAPTPTPTPVPVYNNPNPEKTAMEHLALADALVKAQPSPTPNPEIIQVLDAEKNAEQDASLSDWLRSRVNQLMGVGR